MHPEFERVAIVNRGEAAMRFINAVREFNQERGTRIRTIALYTDPDRRSMFVREADEAFGLGPATVTDPRDGERTSSYLDYERLEAALAASKADAVWTGWGFVSEHAGFAELCERLGIVFIGPPPDAMRRLSDKISAKKLAEDARVPVVPWSGRAVFGAAEAASAAEALGYPVLVKAAAGGGGRGIRVVSRPEEMPEAFESARHESLRAFGDGFATARSSGGIRRSSRSRPHPRFRPTSTATFAPLRSGSREPPGTATPGLSSSSSTRRASRSRSSRSTHACKSSTR
jgi:acetyl/propionyl-CoA carboxylase alpha subunit